MIPPIERRSSRRIPAVINTAVVGFKRRGRRRIAAATLVDISTTGALLSMHEKPRLKAAISIRLEYPVRTPPMARTVVRMTDGGEVGVAFLGACNRTFFWTATRGEDFHLESRPGPPEAAFSREDSTMPVCAGPMPG